MGKGTVGDWIGEICSTIGTGDLILNGKINSSLVEFRNVFADGEQVWYAVSDGNNREAGLGTFVTSTNRITRTTVHSTLTNGVYATNSPAPLALSGGARIFSTFNKAAFDDAIQNTQNFNQETVPDPLLSKEGDTWTKPSTCKIFAYHNTGTQLQWVEKGRGIIAATAAAIPFPSSDQVSNQSGVVGATVTDALNQLNTDVGTAQSTANTALSNAATAQSTANTALSDAAIAQSTANTALSDAATAQSTANTAVSNAATAQSTANNNSSCLGVSNAASMGSFTGSLLPDNQPIKPLLQILETRAEQSMRVFNCVLNGATGTPTGGVDGFTFNDMNKLLGSLPDNCIINVEVEGFLGTWNPDVSSVTKSGCEINIHINYAGDLVKQGIKSTATSGAGHCYLDNCILYIKGENETYSIMRAIAGTSGMSFNGISVSSSRVVIESVTFEYANSAAHASACSLTWFDQNTGDARIYNCTAVWDPVFTPVPTSLTIVGVISAGPNYHDHDLDISYLTVGSPTNLYYTGPVNRKFVSGALGMPSGLGVGGLVPVPLSYPMLNVTSARLRLVCVTAWESFPVGAELIIALGGSSGAEGNEKGLYLSCNRSGTKLIQTINVYVGDQGATHVRNLAPYNVATLDFANFSTYLICRDDS